MSEGNGRGTISYPLAIVVALIGMVISGLTTFYGVRDQAVATARQEIQASLSQIRAEQREALSHYVTREDWATWKEQNRARTDQQFYEQMNAIQRIGARLPR